MNIYEAALAAKAGKIVKHTDSKGFVLEAYWDGYNLQWTAIRSTVAVRESTLNGWYIVEEPPKEYTFVEAYAMIQDGKKMKSCASGKIFQKNPFPYTVASYGMPHQTMLIEELCNGELVGKWIEVN